MMLLILLVMPAVAQNKNELVNRKKKLQREIRLTNKLLKETRKNKDLSVDELLKLKIGSEPLLNFSSTLLRVAILHSLLALHA